MEELDRKETWSTGLDEVRMMWKSQEEEVDEQRWLPTGRKKGDRRARMVGGRGVRPDVWRQNIQKNFHF